GAEELLDFLQAPVLRYRQATQVGLWARGYRPCAGRTARPSQTRACRLYGGLVVPVITVPTATGTLVTVCRTGPRIPIASTSARTGRQCRRPRTASPTITNSAA